MADERAIENQLINKLIGLKYTHRADITNRHQLEQNFKSKFEALNRVSLSDGEFDRLLQQITTADVFKASRLLRNPETFTRDDGTPLQFQLVNLSDWCKNEFEVVNQLKINTRNSHHRYDVILLLNGVPMVQIELKSSAFATRKAMQQIVDYKADRGNGYQTTLLCFMQLFIVSNGPQTEYFSNNNAAHFAFNADEQFLPVYKLADNNNKKITQLEAFAEAFLSKCTLAEMISRYMVLMASEEKLLIMRPYQIYAVKAIVDCIDQNRGNGYIWHTTGSGKTLTSFKASTLLKDNKAIHKCLFVVDRKDLDRQTREEFNRFQENCVEENTNTETLVHRMLSDDYADKVIVTTIQKLSIALDPEPRTSRKYQDLLKPLSDKRIVFIFDECHRSQFGENHQAIKAFFPKAQMFGFTGTPIFEKNSSYRTITGEEASLKTTQDIFEKELHAYTITNAIEDRNVLKFHIDYYKEDNGHPPTDDERKRAIVASVLDKHLAATHQRRFNALFATSSINDAIKYYRYFTEEQKNRMADADYKPLNIACVFSPPAEGNPDIKQIQEDLQQEKLDNTVDPSQKKAALTQIIDDYNSMFGTNFRIQEFDKYYLDVQKRIKDQKYTNADYPQKNKIDVVIVVDMLLTGFDSKYLNTLYVDKNLKFHGLIQAFSRTNRVLNDTKPYGNILDFKGQPEAVNEAIALFSGEKIENPKEIWLVDPAPKVVAKYEQAISELELFMESQGVEFAPDAVENLRGDAARAEFVNRFKEVQRLKTQLEQYTDLDPEIVEQIDELLPDDDMRDFKAVYLETARKLRDRQEKEPDSLPDEAKQLEFEFVLFASAIIDYDYIMKLIADYTQALPTKEKMTRAELIGLLSSSANLMDEKPDIVEYIQQLSVNTPLTETEIREGYKQFKTAKTDNELTNVANKHGLNPAHLFTFVEAILDRLRFDEDELRDLAKTIPHASWQARNDFELNLMEDLLPVLKRKANGQEISGLNYYENGA